MPIYGVFFCVWCFDLSPTICPPALNSDAPPYYFAGLIGGQSVQAEGGLEPLPCRLTPPPDPPLLLLPASSGLPSPLPAPSAWRMWSVRSGVKGSSPGALAPGDSPRPSPSAWEGLAEGGGGNKEAFTGCLAGRGLFGLMRVVRCSLFHVHAPPEWNVDKVWDALPFICLFLVCRCERVSDFGGVFFFWWGLVGFLFGLLIYSWGVEVEFRGEGQLGVEGVSSIWVYTCVHALDSKFGLSFGFFTSLSQPTIVIHLWQFNIISPTRQHACQSCFCPFSFCDATSQRKMNGWEVSCYTDQIL